MAPGRLPSLRTQLAAADRAISDAVRLRMQLAEAIGREKLVQGLPVRDYGVEADVRGWWRSALEPLNIPAERADNLSRWLVEEAVRVQERLGEARSRPRDPKEILLVGGAGAMGRWLGGFLRAGGHRVAVLDPTARPTDMPNFEVVADLAEGLQGTHVVIVATPMSIAPNVYRTIADQLVGTSTLLLDILSVKAPLGAEIARARSKGVRVASVHPLFGPSTRVLSGRNLVLLDCGDSGAMEEAASLFEHSALTLSRMPLERHDSLMAEVLTLPHACSLVFSLVLSRAGPPSDELASRSPVSYGRQAEVARIVTEENPQLSFEIQSLNRGSMGVLARVEEVVHDLRQVVERGSRQEYDALLTEARSFWAQDRSPSAERAARP